MQSLRNDRHNPKRSIHRYRKKKRKKERTYTTVGIAGRLALDAFKGVFVTCNHVARSFFAKGFSHLFLHPAAHRPGRSTQWHTSRDQRNHHKVSLYKLSRTNEIDSDCCRPTSTPTPSGEFPVSGANSLSSTAALFGAILAVCQLVPRDIPNLLTWI